MYAMLVQFIVDLMVWTAIWATISALVASIWLQLAIASIVLIFQVVAREEGWDITELTTLRSLYRKARPRIIDAAQNASQSASNGWEWLTNKVRSKRTEPVKTVMAHESKHMTADGLIVTIRDFRRG